MVIIIREEKRLPNGVLTSVIRYMSDFSPIQGSHRKRAEENDKIIHSKVEKMEEELESKGLLELRGKPGVIKLWYAVGEHLSFVDDLELTPTARKYVWRAIYDHSKELYDKNESIPVRLEERPTTCNLRYAYIIAKNFKWDFVRSAGNWTAWVEFLDSIVMRKDERIINWIRKLQEQTPLRGGFLRKLNRAIRRRLKGIVTTEIINEELGEILDSVYETALIEYNK
jgi:hypothetical protein